MEPLELATLPDDVMIEILKYLSAPELLRCRAVSRRWRDLALHPYLWRRFTLKSGEPHFWTSLRLVPSVGGLCVGNRFALWRPFKPTYSQFMLLAVDTNCAASELRMEICETTLLVLGALMVRRQATLGRLREVKLSLDLTGSKQTASVHTLLQEIRAVQGLLKLEIDGYIGRDYPSVPKLGQTAVRTLDPVEPSIRYLSFDLDNDLALAEEHLLPLVTNHSATLERLICASHHPQLAGLLATAPSVKDFPPLRLRSLAAILPRLSNLRHLTLGAAPSAEFLDAISPKALPALVKFVLFSSRGCSHEWFHTGVLTAMLKRNPRLHAVVRDGWCSDCLKDLFPDREDCTFCVNECQPRCPDGFWKKYGSAVFFSHSESDHCELNEIHNTASKSMKV